MPLVPAIVVAVLLCGFAWLASRLPDELDRLRRYRAYMIDRQQGWRTVNEILEKEDENAVGPQEGS